MTISLVDVILHAASRCHICRTYGRPIDETDQEHGDLFFHKLPPGKSERCRAEQIWALIRDLERK